MVRLGGKISHGLDRRTLRLTYPKEQIHCGECTDDHKDQTIIGMEIVRDARHTADSDWREGGQMLNPDNGKTYTLRLRV